VSRCQRRISANCTDRYYTLWRYYFIPLCFRYCLCTHFLLELVQNANKTSERK